jgi:molybdopterin molybdotransferase
MNLVTVEQANQLILSQLRNFRTETVPFEDALGKILAEDIRADRDLPPFNRVTMDGIAINSLAITQINSFRIKATQAAGDVPIAIDETGQCVEIMTGAALSPTLDTVIRYEDVTISNGVATLLNGQFRKGQNIHFEGADKKKKDLMVAAGSRVTPAITGIAASVGKTELVVKKMPSVIIISSGDELVAVDEQPSPYQIRQSNGYTIKAALRQNGIVADMVHIPDDAAITRQQLEKSLAAYDVLLLSGGVSMGKFDYIPKALEELGVQKLFHKVQQRPGKPFWFGSDARGVLVFAFPGNPVATFMCLRRYFLTWLSATMGIPQQSQFAVLGVDFTFEPDLGYFLQVKLSGNDQAQLVATPLEGNGSGDFANLADTDAFLELPQGRSVFAKGEVFAVWPFDRRF